MDSIVKRPAGDRGPSHRKRFVARAESLRDDQQWYQLLAAYRDEWNRRYPCYRLRGDGKPPPEEVQTEVWPMPVGLNLDLDWLDEAESCGCFPARDPHIATKFPATRPGCDNDPDYEHERETRKRWGTEITQAVGAWKGMIRDFCEVGWPRRDYPHDSGWLRHPAVPFVGLCLLFDPRLVPEVAIASYVYQPDSLPFDPTKDEHHPPLAYWKARAEALETRLMMAIEAESSLNPEQIAATITIAEGFASETEEQTHQLNRAHYPRGWWFVPLLPGLTTKDWRAMEPLVQDAVKRAYRDVDGDDFLEGRCKELAAKGVSQNRIAKKLGIDNKTVRRHLQNAGSR